MCLEHWAVSAEDIAERCVVAVEITVVVVAMVAEVAVGVIIAAAIRSTHLPGQRGERTGLIAVAAEQPPHGAHTPGVAQYSSLAHNRWTVLPSVQQRRKSSVGGWERVSTDTCLL